MHRLADAAFMAGGTLCDSARSSPFILRGGGTHWDDTEVVPPRMDRFLEIILGASLVASVRRADLATSFLGYAVAAR